MKEALDLSVLVKASEVRTEAERYFSLLSGGPVLESQIKLVKPAVDILRREGQIIGQHCFDEGGVRDVILFSAKSYGKRNVQSEE